MKFPATSPLIATCLFALLSMPFSAAAQADVTPEAETVLTVFEGPMSREALNEMRLTLSEQGVRLNYGNFQFHPQTNEMIGAELSMVVDGVSFKEYVEFVSPTCFLRVTKESGFSLEGC
ncbi:hypothetical protein OAH93_01040 [Flavobacteriales bacterium]|nr:hypothetical protein [Flavobacteriales bacterium]